MFTSKQVQNTYKLLSVQITKVLFKKQILILLKMSFFQ